MTITTITITDDRWPRLTLVINRGGKVRTETHPYDIAASQFEPAVKDTLRLQVEEVINSHK